MRLCLAFPHRSADASRCRRGDRLTWPGFIAAKAPRWLDRRKIVQIQIDEGEQGLTGRTFARGVRDGLIPGGIFGP